MSTIWSGGKYNPFDTTVYDRRHQIRHTLKNLERLKTEPRAAHMKRLEKMRENGELD